MAKHCFHLEHGSVINQASAQLGYTCCNCKRRLILRPQPVPLNDARRAGHGKFFPTVQFPELLCDEECKPPEETA